MTILILTLLILCTAFFYTVKIVFTVVWAGEPGSELSPSRDKAFRRVRALKTGYDETSLTVEFGKAFFSTLLTLDLLLVLSRGGLFTLGSNLHTLLYFLVVLVALSLFCKLVPRALARMQADRLVVLYSWMYSGFEALFWPVVALLKLLKNGLYSLLRFEEQLSFLPSDEREKIEGTGEPGGLDRHEKEMIHSILEFRETEAREIMVPRTETVAVAEDADVADIIDIINRHGHSRIPVYRGQIDNIVGILNVKDLYKSYNRECRAFDGTFNIAPLLRPAFFTPPNKRINQLFQELKKEKIHLAVVVDEYGGVSGIVTLEDILEEIVGEIQDEYDREEDRVRRIDDHTVELDPTINLEELNTLLSLSLDAQSDDYKTLSGLIMTHSGSVPHENAEMVIGDLKIRILKMAGHKISRVRLEMQKSNSVS